MNDIDITPVRDLSPNKRSMNGYNSHDNVARRETQETRMITQWTREDLEDKYLRLHEDNLVLKTHARKQEDKIKRLVTTLNRVTNDRKKLGTLGDGGDLADDEVLKKMAELEKVNRSLKEKVQVLKSQLSVQGSKRPSQYERVQPKINSGINASPMAHSHSFESRVQSNMRVLGPRPGGLGSTAPHGLPRSNTMALEESLQKLKQQEHMIAQLNEEINLRDQRIEDIHQQMRLRETEFEEDLLKIKRQAKTDTKLAFQENIDLIKLQRDVREKAGQMSTVQARYQALEAKMATVEATNLQLAREIDRLHSDNRVKDEAANRLDGEVRHQTLLRKQIVELEHAFEDVKRENVVLKESNDKLTGSAFDTERERQWKAKEQALRVQITQLESTQRRDVGEKGDVLNQMERERDMRENAEKEASMIRVQMYELQQKYDELSDKFRFFTKESHVDMAEVEEALVLIRKRKETGSSPGLDFLTRVDGEANFDMRRRMEEVEAGHAETIEELEKTRNMLIVQYKINKDYKLEADAVSNRMEELKIDYESKLNEYAKLLDIRAARIHKLEHQLKDIAYGTRQYQITKDMQSDGSMMPGGEADDDNDDVDEAVALQRGENLLEVHVGKLILSDTGVRAAQLDQDVFLFVTWDFYDFETQATAVMRGVRPDFDLTAQYPVRVDDFLLHYLNKDSLTLEVHQAIGSEYRTIAACQLSCRQLLERQQGRGRVHLTAQLVGVGAAGVHGEDMGMIEYWVRLRVPMDQALRLYRERSKALGYVSANQASTMAALHALDDKAGQRPADNVNELHIKVNRCRGIRARRPDLQPSTYCVYKFFDMPDHDTPIVPASNAPEFHDHKIYPVHTTPDLDRFLKSQPLHIYVFDDTDPDSSAFLGLANVPLIPLAHDKPVVGEFELRRPDGSSNGAVEVELRWKFAYLPVTYGGTPILPASVSTPAPVPLLPGEEQKMSREKSKGTSQATRAEQLKSEEVHAVHEQRPSTPETPRVQSPPKHVSPPHSPPDHVHVVKPEKKKGILKQPADGSYSPRKDLLQSTRIHQEENSAKRMPMKSLRQSDDIPTSMDASITRLDSAQHTMVSEGTTVSGESATVTSIDGAKEQVQDYIAGLSKLDDVKELDTEGIPEETEEITEQIDESEMPEDGGPETEPATQLDLTKEEDYSHSSENPTSVNSQSQPIAPPRRKVGSDPRPTQPSVDEQAGSSEDSDAVVVSSSGGLPASVRDSVQSTGSNGNGGPPGETANTVVVEVGHVEMDPGSALMRDPKVKMLFVEYKFLGLPPNQTETPFGLPKPRDSDRQRRMNFNFRKVFHVDFENNYERRQYLASMILPDDPNEGKIPFFLVNEPPEEEESGDCDEVGFTSVSVRDIYRENKDYENKMIPIYSTTKPNKEIGRLCVSVKCLSALKAIVEEMPGVKIAV